MKRHQFCRPLFVALIALTALSGCEPAPRQPAAPSVPAGVHVAPNAAINLTPTRPGNIIAAPELGAPEGASPASMMPGRTVRVGLLLPLTGRNAALGRTMQDAATVALFDKYARLSTAQQNVRVELLPKDTGDTPEQAVTAIQEAITDGAQLIIGPIFGPATEAVAPIAKAKNVPVISFTNNTALASPGVYAFGFSPQEQTERVIDYAVRQGKTGIAALVPDSPSGELILKAARDTLAKSGLALAAEARYSPEGVGIEQALAKLLPQGSTANFDTLLLPEGGPALPVILRALAARGISQRNVQFVGTGFWDNPSLLRRTALDGAWLASSPPQSTAQFEQRFSATYGTVPLRTTSLAYDAVALAVTLATSGRNFDAVALTQSAGYSGPANGIFRLKPNGTVQRGLAVLRVEGVNMAVIDAAPAGFTSSAATQ